MSIKLLNVPAIMITVISCGLAFAVRFQWPWVSIGLMVALAAVLCLGLDVYWRSDKGKRHWFNSSWGGSVLHMPLWLLAVVWLGLSAYQTYVRPIPALAKAAPAMTWQASADQSQPNAQAQKH